MREFSAQEAWQNVNERNPEARWKSVSVRAKGPTVLATYNERVGIKRDDDIFCIGSCFAKNIERKLVAAGFRVVSHPKFAPGPGEPFTPLPNIFNVRSIINEFRWGLTNAKPAPEESFLTDDHGFVYDPHAAADTFRGPADVVGQRRAGITANMRRLRDCRIVVLTLGLVEVWYDRQNDMYLNSTLPRFFLERDPERYVLRALDYSDCRNGLEELWELLHHHGRPDVEIFLSVSPVPLAATFTPNDVLIANTYSKSTQMAAAWDFAQQHDNVHYIPSYESVMNSARHFAWKGDLRHVTDEMVDHVTAKFLASHLVDGSSVLVVPAAGHGDWPVDLSDIELHAGVPKFSSASPGDRDFPAGFPKVTASSVLAPQHDASCLMSAAKRIWHSQAPAAYPEWLHFSFDKPLAVRKIFVQNQDGHPERSPVIMAFDARVGAEWQTVLVVQRAQWRYGGEWQNWQVQAEIPSAEFRLRILANNGDPNLVTVQNAYLSP